MEPFQGMTDECCRNNSGNECEFTDATCDGRGLTLRIFDDDSHTTTTTTAGPSVQKTS